MKQITGDTRNTKCYNCEYMGEVGQDSRGTIAWCLLQSIVVDPNLGCRKALFIRPDLRLVGGVRK